MYAYRTCPDFNQLVLNDITIGSRTYKGDVQKTLFIEAANHGNGTGHYCRRFIILTSTHDLSFEKNEKTIAISLPENCLFLKSKNLLEYCKDTLP